MPGRAHQGAQRPGDHRPPGHRQVDLVAGRTDPGTAAAGQHDGRGAAGRCPHPASAARDTPTVKPFTRSGPPQRHGFRLTAQRPAAAGWRCRTGLVVTRSKVRARSRRRAPSRDSVRNDQGGARRGRRRPHLRGRLPDGPRPWPRSIERTQQIPVVRTNGRDRGSNPPGGPRPRVPTQAGEPIPHPGPIRRTAASRPRPRPAPLPLPAPTSPRPLPPRSQAPQPPARPKPSPVPRRTGRRGRDPLRRHRAGPPAAEHHRAGHRGPAERGVAQRRATERRATERRAGRQRGRGPSSGRTAGGRDSGDQHRSARPGPASPTRTPAARSEPSPPASTDWEPWAGHRRAAAPLRPCAAGRDRGDGRARVGPPDARAPPVRCGDPGRLPGRGSPGWSRCCSRCRGRT